MSAPFQATNSRPLSGKHIIITRPYELGAGKVASDALQELLEQQGARVTHLPLVHIERVPFTFPEVTEWDWLFFTSKNAVHSFFSSQKPDWFPAGLPSIAVVGPATAQVVAEYGAGIDFVSPQYDALNAAQAFQNAYDCEGLRILWPCGNLANPGLAEDLSKAGAYIKPLVVYETHQRPALSPSEQAMLLEGANMVVFTSPSAVFAWEALGLAPVLDKMAVACIGPRTAEASEKRLHRVDVQANPYTVPALVDTVVQFYTHSIGGGHAASGD